jgi:hypothetical protein
MKLLRQVAEVIFVSRLTVPVVFSQTAEPIAEHQLIAPEP